MTKEVFEEHIRKIAAMVDTLPEPQRGQLNEMIEETRRRFANISGSMSRARDALDDLRLYQTYAIFDAEARLRETQAQRRNLDEGNSAQEWDAPE